MRTRRFALVVAVAGVMLAGCAAPGQNGLGATMPTWNALHHHDADYQQVLTDAHGHVDEFVLALAPTDLADAVQRVRGDLPTDTVTGQARLMDGIEGAQCEIVDFTSSRLGTILGSADVMAVFRDKTEVGLNPRQITRAVVVSGDRHPKEQC